VKSICPICNRRRAERFCPAKGESICAVCCGTQREITLDCPSDCSWLLAARRHEAHHRDWPRGTKPSYPDVDIPRDFVHENYEALSGLMSTVGEFSARNRSLRDSSALDALRSLTETYRTLQSGIYYERPPDAALTRALYDALVNFLRDFREQQAAHGAIHPLKDSQIFRLLVFLLRVGEITVNGRPLSRAFLDYIREEVLAVRGAAGTPQTTPGAAPRIIIP
jgi:hypothetical protein